MGMGVFLPPEILSMAEIMYFLISAFLNDEKVGYQNILGENRLVI